ncbi:MAG: tetratricopeptide repeat protein [Saprospiraceae bacterium]|nr:tetratricopeptide repeat protein [Saprospiraceae bacterium]
MSHAIEKGVMDALNNLANLYDDRGNVEQAEKCYLLAIEKGDFIALNNLALCTKTKEMQNKQKILSPRHRGSYKSIKQFGKFV